MKTKNLVLTILLFATFLFVNPGWSDVSADAPRLETQGIILYVKPGAIGTTCTSWTDACELQAALSLVQSGDQIWVAAGTYRPTTGSDRFATFQLKSGVAIYGGFPATGDPTWEQRAWETNTTTLSGDIGTETVTTDNSYHVVTGSGVDETTVLDGFSISDGNSNGSSPDNNGGGMYNTNSSSPELTNILFSGNSSSNNGGGMFNEGGSPKFTNVLFSGNTASVSGGGMSTNSSNLMLTNVDFLNNSARFGGGLLNIDGNIKLTDVLFYGNTATNSGGGMENGYSSPELINVTFSDNTSGNYGGGMTNNNGGSPTLKNVTFSGNHSTSGGGLRNDGGSPTLTNVVFSSNTATFGGGMSNTPYSNPILTNVTFSNNSAILQGGGLHNNYCYVSLLNVTFSANASNNLGGGIYNFQSSPTLTNVTFSENSATNLGGGIYNGGDLIYSSRPVILNSILWANTPDQISNDSWSSTTITYSIIQDGGYPDPSNIDADPLLGLLADNGGFTHTHALGDNSPAIDASDPYCPSTDQRGFYRPIDGDGDGTPRCDIGAYEYGSGLFTFLPLVLR